MKDRFIIGGPDQFIRALQPFVEQYGMTHLICRLFFPGMPHAHIMRELELLAKEVVRHSGDRAAHVGPRVPVCYATTRALAGRPPL